MPPSITNSKEATLFQSLRRNPAYYLENLLKIETKAGELDYFKPNEQQLYILNLISALRELEIPVRLVILKARQIGMSTLGAAMLFHATSLWAHRHAKVIAHDLDTTELLFEKTKTFYSNLPEEPLLKPKTDRSDGKRLIFSAPVSSRITISTAGTKTAGSGSTVQYLHASEVAKWENAGKVMTSLMQAVPSVSINPNTIIIIESTAFGQGGYYHKMYKQSKEGKEQLMKDLWEARFSRKEMVRIISEFPRNLGWMPIFFPWQEFKEYAEPVVDKEWFAKSLNDEEIKLRHELGLSYEQLQFRRTKMEQLAQDEEGVPPEVLFQQEYPSNDVEAFIVTGSTVFSKDALNRMKPKPLLFQGEFMEEMQVMEGDEVRYLTYEKWEQKHRDDHGKITLDLNKDRFGGLKIWVHPEEGHQYALGVDVAIGERGESDFSVIQVVDRQNGEQVAEWVGKGVLPYTLGRYAVQLGAYYNEAVVAIENNSFGIGAVQSLQHSLYPYPYIKNSANYKTITEAPTEEWGWNTNQMTKPMVVTNMARFIQNRLTSFNSPGLIEEASIFRKDGAKMGAPDGDHDDRVMAMAIALWVVLEHPFEGAIQGSTPLISPASLEKTAEVYAEEWDNEEDLVSSYA